MKRLSKRELEAVRVNAKEITEAERALYILQGLTPCPRCKGVKTYQFRREYTIGGRYYHFSRTCHWCSQTETPGYFTPQEATDYGITELSRRL